MGGQIRDLFNYPLIKLVINAGHTVTLRLHGAVYRRNSFVLVLSYCANFKAIRCESVSLNRVVADKLHRVVVAKACS